MISAIRHTGIVVTDMDRSLRFYHDLLQVGRVVCDHVVANPYIDRVTGLSNARIRIVMLEAADEGRVELLQYLSHPREGRNDITSCDIGCSHVALQVENVDRLYQRLMAAGTWFHSPPQVDPNGYAKVAYCRDPDNAIVELVQVLSDGNSPYLSTSQSADLDQWPKQ